MSKTRLATLPLTLALAFSVSSLAVAQDSEPADPVTSATGEVSDTLIPQDGALATYEEHIRALNACDWLGLMAQYPNNAELHFVDNALSFGREAVGAVFDGFVPAREDGGLCGIVFTEESRLEVGDTEVVQWVAEADFLAEPYRGSDAYVTDGQYMVSMVSTFDGSKLVFSDVQAEDAADDPEQNAEDAADDAEAQAEDKADDGEDKADAKEDELEDKADAKEDELEDKADK
jgi:hypothetical protein